MIIFLTSSLKMRAWSSQPIRFCTNLKTCSTRRGSEGKAAPQREMCVCECVRVCCMRFSHLVNAPRCNLLGLNALDAGQQLAVLLPAQRQRAVGLRAQSRQEQ